MPGPFLATLPNIERDFSIVLGGKAAGSPEPNQTDAPGGRRRGREETPPPKHTKLASSWPRLPSLGPWAGLTRTQLGLRGTLGASYPQGGGDAPRAGARPVPQPCLEAPQPLHFVDGPFSYYYSVLYAVKTLVKLFHYYSFVSLGLFLQPATKSCSGHRAVLGAGPRTAAPPRKTRT